MTRSPYSDAQQSTSRSSRATSPTTLAIRLVHAGERGAGRVLGRRRRPHGHRQVVPVLRPAGGTRRVPLLASTVRHAGLAHERPAAARPRRAARRDRRSVRRRRANTARKLGAHAALVHRVRNAAAVMTKPGGTGNPRSGQLAQVGALAARRRRRRRCPARRTSRSCRPSRPARPIDRSAASAASVTPRTLPTPAARTPSPCRRP